MNGIELSRRFHFEFVEPTIAKHFPGLLYASALIGPGSEVLGFDTEMSTDHDWGPRVLLFLPGHDAHLIDVLLQALRSETPERFYGYSVDLSQTTVNTLGAFLEEKLGKDISKGLELVDWLTFPSQVLAELTGGEVFRDDGGMLTAIREQLHYYPQDVWLYLLASVWNRIGQEEHLALRAGYVGDELGSSIIASRLIRDMLHLCFLMERQYAPYPKWFGTAFKQLNGADDLLPLLQEVQSAATWNVREEGLCSAYEYIARKHNQLGITGRMHEHVAFFYDRPFKVIQGGEFAQAISSAIVDPTIRKLSEYRLIGGIDQISDNTDFLLINQWHQHRGLTEGNLLKTFYGKLLG